MTWSWAHSTAERPQSAVISLDGRGRVIYWNAGAESVFGFARAEALGRPVAELIIPARFRAAHRAGIARVQSEGCGPVLDRRLEVSALHADGRELPVEMTVTAVRQGSQWTFTAFVQDISWRGEAQHERERLLGQLREALTLSERRFDAIVGSLSDPVTIRDRDDTLVYANRAALDHLGFESLQELRRTRPEQIMADYLVFDERGRELSMNEIPSVRMLRGEAAAPLLIRTVSRSTGAQRWNLLKAAPLVDEAGQTDATIMIIEDVTEQKRAERASAYLARASEVLSSSLDYQQTLRNIAELAVPDIVDWCAIDLFSEDGNRIPVALAHADPERLALAEQLRQHEPVELDPSQGLGLVLRTGEPMLYAHIPDQMLVEAAVDDRHLELLRSVGFRSAAIVPMRLRRQTLGAMTLVSAESGRALDQLDVDLASQVASRGAVAIENSRLYGERARIAQTLQESLLPQLPELPGYDLASLYLPAVSGAEVGGDFYDAWDVEDDWMVAIGDVTGKGVEAAALTAMVRHTIRSASEFVSDPAGVLERVDRALKKRGGLSLCTAVCIRLHGDRATLAVAGHPLPFLLGPQGVLEVGQYGPLLGGLADPRWTTTNVELRPDSTLMFYTDGVTDAVGVGRGRFGLERLRAILRCCRDRSAATVIETIASALQEFQQGAQADDTAVLALHRLPSTRGQGLTRQAATSPPMRHGSSRRSARTAGRAMAAGLS